MRDVVERLGAILGALLAVGAVVTGLWRTGRRLGAFLDDWFGEGRPGSERPGVMVRLASLETTVGKIDKELHPNGGGSLRDQVNQIAKATGAEESASPR